MTPTRQPHPHEKCHECHVFFKCEQLPPCAPHTPARQPQQEYIITADELQKLMSWSTHKSPGVCQYERRLEILRKVETRPHTSAHAPRPPCEECIYQAQAASAAKAAREHAHGPLYHYRS